ncbi:MAG: signal peptidase I [Actinomycetota bacterium]|nr:signal peptidase I [Actinomycetota bacterium]
MTERPPSPVEPSLDIKAGGGDDHGDVPHEEVSDGNPHEDLPDEDLGYQDLGDEDGGEDGPSLARNIAEWAAILVGALVVALVVTKFLIQAFFIPSGSMLPTLHIDDRVLVNKLSYDLHDVNRGDLVVFERPASEADSDIKDLIKRVVAVEGETVESRDGRLYINGEALDEPYLQGDVKTNGVDLQTIPPGHVFVMGDNRGDSRDSRFFGPLPEELIVGRAFVKVWPLPDFQIF